VVAEAGKDVATALAGKKEDEIANARNHSRFMLDNFYKDNMGPRTSPSGWRAT